MRTPPDRESHPGVSLARGEKKLTEKGYPTLLGRVILPRQVDCGSRCPGVIGTAAGGRPTVLNGVSLEDFGWSILNEVPRIAGKHFSIWGVQL